MTIRVDSDQLGLVVLHANEVISDSNKRVKPQP
jgi:hypothetical protein